MELLDEFIKEIRKFGIKNASELSGVTQNTIGNWVRVRTMPALDKAQKVANAMGLEFLLFERSNNTNV